MKELDQPQFLKADWLLLAIAFFFVATLSLLGASTFAAVPADQDAKIDGATRLGEVPTFSDGVVSEAGHFPWYIRGVVTDDRRHVAWAINKTGDAHVTIDGVEGPRFDEVKGLHFAASGKHCAYAGRIGRTWYPIVDQQQGAPCDEIQQWASGGDHYAFAIRRAGKMLAVIDGVESSPYDLVWFLQFSDDGHHVAYAFTREGKSAVNIDGTELSTLGNTLPSIMHFAPSGSLVFVTRSGDQAEVMIDGHPFAIDKKVNSVSLERVPREEDLWTTSGHFEQEMIRDGLSQRHPQNTDDFWRFNDQNIQTERGLDGLDQLHESSAEILFLSADCRRIAFVANDPKNNVVALVDNGKFGKSYGEISGFRFSGSGKHYAYIGGDSKSNTVRVDPLFLGQVSHSAQIAVRGGSPQRVVKDGEEGPKYDLIDNLVLSPDGSRYACKGVRDGQYYMVVDGLESGSYDPVNPGNLGDYAYIPIFSPDGEHVAFRAIRKGKWVAVLDGKESEEFDSVGEPTFSGNGKHWGFVARREHQMYMVLDETPQLMARKFIGDPLFSFDGQHVFYALETASLQTNIVPYSWMVDGREISHSYIFRAPNNDHAAWTVDKSSRNGHRGICVSVDGKEGPTYDEIITPIVFSPDGKHVAYLASANPGRFGDVRTSVVLDGQPGPTFDGIPWSDARGCGAVFSDDGTELNYFGERNGVIYQVRQKVDRAGALLDVNTPIGGQSANNKFAAAALDIYVGKYRLASVNVITVTRSGDHLVAQWAGKDPFDLSQTSERVFADKSQSALEFIKDDRGNVTSLIMHVAGKEDRTARRIGQ